MRSIGKWAAVGLLVAWGGGAVGCTDDDGDTDAGTDAGIDAGIDGGTDAGVPDSGVIPAGAGLTVEIQDATVPATGSPTVTFKITDGQGNPITDLATEIQNAEATLATGQTRTEPFMRPRFSFSQLEPNATYTSYYEVDVPSQPFTGGTPALASATQPRTEPPSASPFPLASLDQARANEGIYTYTLTAPTTPAAKLDRTLPHRVGLWTTRTAAGVAAPVSATKDFNPSGAAVTTVQTVTTQACNTCHTAGLRAHDNRRTVELCITCHAGDRGTSYLDPESGNDLDAWVMFHKIHRGENLPSVENGTPYRIIGRQGAVHDYSDVAFPRDIRDCTVCHTGTDADRWQTAPGLKACTSCHDNAQFDGSATGACTPGQTTVCNHPGGPLPGVQNCTACHTPAAIAAAHVPPSQLATQYRFEITSASLDAQRQPVVNFRVVNTTTNANIDIKTDPQFNQPGGASRLAVEIGWPAAEYTNSPAVGTMQYGQPISTADAKTASTANADGTFTLVVPTPVPAGVTGTATAVLEGHPATTTGIRLPVPTAVTYFDVAGGAAVPRREVVSVENCNRCHGELSAHGSNRNDTVLACSVCHNTNATDKARRPAGVVGETPINFSFLIHLVHASELRPDDPVTIYGFGGTPHEFPIRFPGELGNCLNCHVGTTYALPLPAAVTQGPTSDSAGTPADYTDNVRLPPVQTVCTACHGSVSFSDALLPACKTVTPGKACSHDGGLNLPDTTCAGCHGPGAVSDVAKTHPIHAP